nr:plasmid pRiA4b ORF-3 family protein [Burkholderia cenocepacia]
MVQPRKPAVRLVKAPVPDYILRVELKYIKPAIWRRIVVPGSIRLGKLHVVLQLAMGWEGGHLHEFVFGEPNYGEPDDFGFQSDPPMLNEAQVTLSKALGGLKSFTYIYDYGDNWQHRIKVEKALVPDPDMRRPLCLDGQNACPSEDVGGVPGYAGFLEAITDPAHDVNAGRNFPRSVEVKFPTLFGR